MKSLIVFDTKWYLNFELNHQKIRKIFWRVRSINSICLLCSNSFCRSCAIENVISGSGMTRSHLQSRLDNLQNMISKLISAVAQKSEEIHLTYKDTSGKWIKLKNVHAKTTLKELYENNPSKGKQAQISEIWKSSIRPECVGVAGWEITYC